MTPALNRSGRIQFTTLLLLIALAAGGYCAVAFGKVWWHKYTIQDTIDRELSFAGQLVDESIRQRLVARLNEMNLPPAARKVQVTRTSPKSIEVAIQYTETVNLVFTRKRIPVSIRQKRTY